MTPGCLQRTITRQLGIPNSEATPSPTCDRKEQATGSEGTGVEVELGREEATDDTNRLNL